VNDQAADLPGQEPTIPLPSDRAAGWQIIDRLLDQLPSPLLQQAIMLRHVIATRYAVDGQWHHVLLHDEDAPALDLHAWLLRDLLPESADVQRLIRHGFAGLGLLWCATILSDLIDEPDSIFDAAFRPLARRLTQLARPQLRRVCPAESPFWQHYPATPALTDLPYLGAVLAVYASARLELLEPLHEISLQISAIFQTRRDVTMIRRDLACGRLTPPIQHALESVGLPLDPPWNPPQVLGALVLNGVVPRLAAECHTRLASAQQLASDLKLATLTCYLNRIGGLIDELGAVFSLLPLPKPMDTPQLVIAQPFDSSALAITMAQGYLLQDRSFQESWEIQRQGMFGKPEVVARAFPAGTIIELLIRNGEQLPEEVDTVCDLLHASRFSYYHDSGEIFPDGDDLGLVLRLLRYSARPEQQRALLEAPLAWMEAGSTAAGVLPVWFLPPDEELQVVLWGDTCITVQAQLVLGLLDFDASRYQAQIRATTLHICQALARVGLAANHYYVPLYSLWILGTLIARMLPLAADPALAASLRPTQTWLARRLERELRRPLSSAQDCALRLLGSCALEIAPGLRAGWHTRIIKLQRYDGSWDAEPLFITSTRGGMPIWYSSHLVTTAIIYHALCLTAAAEQDPSPVR